MTSFRKTSNGLLVFGHIVALAAMVSAFLPGCSSSCRHPSDAELAALFHRHARDFERLVEMIENDRCIVRLDMDWTSPDAAGLSHCEIGAPRIAEYRKILHSISVERGFYYYADSSEVWFVVSAQGLALTDAGSSKSIVFKRGPVAVVGAAPDECECRSNERGSLLVPVEGNWYIGFRC